MLGKLRWALDQDLSPIPAQVTDVRGLTDCQQGT